MRFTGIFLASFFFCSQAKFTPAHLSCLRTQTVRHTLWGKRRLKHAKGKYDMNVLVVGGTGATGKYFVNRLLSQGCKVTIVVRNGNNVDSYFKDKKNLNVITGNVLEMEAGRLRELVKNVDAIGSCLGHPQTLKGTFGEPRKLVTESVQKLCQAVQDNDQNKPVKMVLMNTVGVRNKDIQEKWPIGDGIIFFLTGSLVPQQRDNEQAAEYLRSHIGKNNKNIEWVIVRPDRLLNGEEITEYKVLESIIRSPIFDGGTTNRINVGDFMSELIVNHTKWNEWKGKMPVIYNISSMDTP